MAPYSLYGTPVPIVLAEGPPLAVGSSFHRNEWTRLVRSGSLRRRSSECRLLLSPAREPRCRGLFCRRPQPSLVGYRIRRCSRVHGRRSGVCDGFLSGRIQRSLVDGLDELGDLDAAGGGSLGAYVEPPGP